ncbi:SDR family NAD(P)-dependent oxidoreductase [Streptomyces sp. 4F14]|uniref:SDR family NAD(P)-dependent oxidoreductase n=1 Tax=Streptomyces sp. 4F14 TaxID=3394380 RepID=UPI003A878BB7
MTDVSCGVGKVTALALVAAGSGVVQEAIERFGRIDVLVDDAGVGSPGGVEETRVEQVRAVFDCNVFGVRRSVTAVLSRLRARKYGCVISISSVLGFMSQPCMAVHAASKCAIEGYSESLDREVREHGIRSILVEPACTRTGFEAGSAKADTPLHAYAR